MLKRILLLLLAPIVGCVAGFGLAFLFESGWFYGWRPVATPPEPAAAIHAISGTEVWIETASGQLYHNAAAQACAADCWEAVAAVVTPPPDPDIRNVLPRTCVTPPPLLGAVQTVAECQVSQWVDFNTAYARRGNGSLMIWRFTSGGEWVGFSYVLLSLFGAVALFILALAAIIVVWLIGDIRRRLRASAAV